MEPPPENTRKAIASASLSWRPAWYRVATVPYLGFFTLWLPRTGGWVCQPEDLLETGQIHTDPRAALKDKASPAHVSLTAGHAGLKPVVPTFLPTCRFLTFGSTLQAQMVKRTLATGRAEVLQGRSQTCWVRLPGWGPAAGVSTSPA